MYNPLDFCRCNRCDPDWEQHGWICPAVLQQRSQTTVFATATVRDAEVVVNDILNGEDGVTILRIAPKVTPGGLQHCLEQNGRIIAGCIATSLCAIARWRWMIILMLFAKQQ